MAGRVERRINDKFYFVLDEVGGSSDCESDQTLENDTKASTDLNPKDIMSSEDGKSDAPATKGDLMENELESDKSNSEVLAGSETNDATTSQDSICSSKNDKKRDNIEANLTDYNEDICPNKKPNNLQLDSEVSSAVVDMDIDSDLEGMEGRIEPLIRITFRDAGLKKLLKSSLHNFLSEKITNCTIITNSENNLELEVYDKNPAKLLQDDLLDFDLDTTPGENYSEVPHYGKSHEFVLSDINPPNEDSKINIGPSKSCFNCMGAHNLRDCPKPKDYRIISQNRAKNKVAKTSRYHSDENQKFSHIAPGVISKKLRNALNLRRDQAPGFIYRMRLLGYPPAWLEEAKVCHSGVAMYDSKGALVLEEDEEEGEIVAEGAKDRYDVTKIIDFPGFNVPLPNSFKDESKFYSCPAISEVQSKEVLIKQLEPQTAQAYVKKALTIQKSEEPPSQDDQKKMNASIEELEEKKRQLLMELNDEDSALDSKLNSEDSSSGISQATKSDLSQNVESKEVGRVKCLEFGTPILKSVSPFSKLPSREQFSVNVSDVINFENLPNSTGKYETMRHVISKIRISTSKTQSE